MSNVAILKLSRRVSRQHALNWLKQSSVKFPIMRNDAPISSPVFHDWRFVLALDGVVYFADCIEAGITESEVLAKVEDAA